VIKAMTGLGVSGSNSVLLASFQAGHVAGELDGGHLHAQTNAQVRNLVFAGKTGGADLAFDTAFAKSAGHQHGVKLGQRDTLSGVIVSESM
jgi:hypothetical protein